MDCAGRTGLDKALPMEDTAPRRRRRMRRPLGATMAVVRDVCGGLAAVVAIWQAAIWLFQPPGYMLPAPADVLAVLAERHDILLRNAAITLSEALLGLLFGTLAGAAAAIGMAASPLANRLAWPLLLVLQAIPVFAIAPLLVVWFGFGLASKVVMTSLVIFFPVTSAFADGIRRTDPFLLDACALTAATRWQTLMAVRVPMAMPGFISGLRVAAPLAPLAAVVGEWVGAAGGLGFLMLQANARMQTGDVFAALFILAVLTLALRACVDAATTRLVPWQREAP